MNELIISKAAVAHNAAVIRSHSGRARIIGVVKGNGYGVGTAAFAQLLTDNGAEILAAASLDDALTLRRSGFTQPLLLMSPLYDSRQLEQALQSRLILTLASRSGVAAAEQAAARLGLTGAAHIAVDTGFGRYGFSSSEPEELIAAAAACRRIRPEGVFSHLADAGGRKTEHTLDQYHRFLTASTALAAAGFTGLLRHLANSAATLRFDYTRLDAVRIGSAWLGRLPGAEQWGLQKTGWLRSFIADIYDRPAGANIGYGCICRLSRPTRTAVIPAGIFQGFALERGRGSWRSSDLLHYLYADLRSWLRRAHHQVEINGVPCRVLGPVGLNSLVADISNVDCRIGDPVRLEISPIFADSSLPRIIE